MTHRQAHLVVFFLSCVAWQLDAQSSIKAAIADFDIEPAANLAHSVDNYLSRYLEMPASDENRFAAEDFLKAMYFVSRANCDYKNIGGDSELRCHIKSKRSIRKITILNLPASLLEDELKRKLPMQIGQSIEIDESLSKLLVVARQRTETFLRKNGFYGAYATVSRSAAVDSLEVDITVVIKGGVFAQVNQVFVYGDPPISIRAVKKKYQRLCLSLNRIIESMSIGTLSCYSRELEREATQGLQDRFARMGYVQSKIRISHHWVDPRDKRANKVCQSTNQDDTPWCVDLRIDIDKGPKVRWSINVKDGLAINRNAFLQFLGTLFSVDQFSRATLPDESDEVPLDHMIVKEQVFDKITFVSAKNVDDQEIKESATEITNYLVSRGFNNAHVDPFLIQEDASNILVNFDVYAGKPHAVSSVRILPDKYAQFISQDDLETLVKVRSITDNGHLSYKEIDFAKEEIKNRLINHGFMLVNITVDMESIDNNNVDVVFYVTTDDRNVVDEIVILNGYQDLNEQILPLLQNCDNYSPPSRRENQTKRCKGSSFVESKIDADENRIAEFYKENAFLYAKVKSEVTESNLGNRIVFIVYDDRFGESSTAHLKRQEIKDIIISGNHKTMTGVLKRLFPVERKSPILDPLVLKKGIANIRQSGRFSRIDHKILAGEKDSDDVYFLMQLTERPSVSLDMGIAFSTDQLFMLEAELEEANLFSSMLKLNTSLGLGLFWGRQSIFNNKLIWPLIFGKPLHLTINAPTIIYNDLTHRRNDPVQRLQSKISFGLEWRPFAKIMPFLKYSLTMTQEQKFTPTSLPNPTFRERISTLDGLIPTIKTKPSNLRGILKPGLSYIDLDHPFDPHKGFDLSVWTEFSGGPFIGTPPWINLGTENRLFLPLGPLTIALQATFMRAFITPSDHNFGELTKGSIDYLGGDRSIRGYKEGSIGIKELRGNASRYAGYFANIANVELRFPITRKTTTGNFSGALFVDQGMLVPCASLFDCTENKSIRNIIARWGFGLSFGAAIRYALPVGPISLDYGISPLTGDGRVHLLFGYAF